MNGKEGRIVAIGAAEAVGEVKESQAMRTGRGSRKPRVGQANGAEVQRYFLGKAGGAGGVPEFGKEFATEPEAIVESLKAGLSYFSVVEWRGVADFSGKKAKLTKEAVTRGTKAG
jgi:hypothetical protein